MKTLFSLLLAVAATTNAAAIISVSAPNPSVAAGSAVNAASWTQTGSYSNVSVAAVLSNFSGVGAGLAMHAYLTNQIGAGTTVANEIASTAFTLSPGNAQNVTLFNNLTLGTGTYFLVLLLDNGTTAQGGWAADVPTVVTDSGVTHGADRFATTAAGYAPATVMSTSTAGQRLLFDVTSNDVSVPEPAAVGIVSLALVLILGRTIRRR